MILYLHIQICLSNLSDAQDLQIRKQLLQMYKQEIDNELGLTESQILELQRRGSSDDKQ